MTVQVTVEQTPLTSSKKGKHVRAGKGWRKSLQDTRSDLLIVELLTSPSACEQRLLDFIL